MIVSKTPLRVSLFGGGTDYPLFFQEEPGRTISFAISSFCYISIQDHAPILGYEYHLRYFKTEKCNSIDEIKHPAIRAAFEVFNIRAVELVHKGDLPSRAGLGSSSSFSVGLLNLLNFRKEQTSLLPQELAQTAINFEQNIIGEAVGCQDQIVAAYGGMLDVIYNPDRSFLVRQQPLTTAVTSFVTRNCILCFSGSTRNAFEFAGRHISTIEKNRHHIREIKQLADIGGDLLRDFDKVSPSEFGALLSQQWAIKKALNPGVSSDTVDEIYQTALNNGAYGGKLLGAGGGGFILFVVDEAKKDIVKEALRPLYTIDIQISAEGSVVAKVF
jgi:D-glycero-alpha-D-manno-heptose-7-phosphate kinase